MTVLDRSFRAGPWTVDPAGLTLSHGDATVHLRPKVMELLTTFAAHQGEVLAKRKLLDLVWPDVTVGDSSLTVAVRELREALGDSADAPSYIETIARRGYRLIAPIAVLAPESRSRSTSPSRYWLIGHENRFALVEGRNVIGRAPDADVRIPSTKVSRHHAQITVDGTAAAVEDLNSKNGTFLGGIRIDQPTPLAHGDELRLGKMAATLQVVVVGRQSTVTEMSEVEAKERSPDHPPIA